MATFGYCLPNPDPQMRALQELVGKDARAALRQSQRLLDTARDTGHPGAAAGVDGAAISRTASLYAVAAEAQGVLELDAGARESAEQGLALAADPRDPVHVALMLAYLGSVYDAAGIGTGMRTAEQERQLQTPGSAAEQCLLVIRGLLEHRSGREDLAVATLTQAYRSSAQQPEAEAHVASAENLSMVMRDLGDYNQALSLNQEQIDWDSAHDAATELSVARFMRGRILKKMGDYRGAIVELTAARALSVSLDDSQAIAFADMEMCEAHIELGALQSARRECDNALRLFGDAWKSAKEARLLEARIDLGLGRPQVALATLDGVLEHGGADLPPREVTAIYEWRARVNAALHDYRHAYDDLQEYLSRYTAANDAARVKQDGALRARFATDREIERNSSLKRELESSQEQTERQRKELRLNGALALLGAGVIALLGYFLLANRRYRAQLLALANQDPLTGLPNRRRTAELAVAAIDSAAGSGRPLTVAVIDMDHFKAINDRCGHAAGDHVLREFARAGREALRTTDILGRWGGEEFLLVMPDTPTEVAHASLERLRTLMFTIRLPSTAGGLKVSLSAGLAFCDASTRSLEDLIARADAALYAAKNDGRDLVRIADRSGKIAQGGYTSVREA
ncbi:MAG TPA: GGDEF domain-containing protein [Steroidobacteraceae bacterium]|jgi:diguanylate cyclase (GGDEF)-like protein|nr:GGDEF domain-containing protein [Steroidobacteraceae bacterium]